MSPEAIKAERQARWDMVLAGSLYKGCGSSRRCGYGGPCGLNACRETDKCELDRMRERQEPKEKKMPNDGQDHCSHGVAVNRKEVDLEGWVTPYADDCWLCESKPAGLRYKPGTKP